MRRRTRLDYEERIEAATRYIVEHLDERIDPRELADHVCFSRFHFHRVFQALTGETIGDLVRRLRLERAAVRLRSDRAPITELALEAGYTTHPAFVRAFRAAFGCTPSVMRHHRNYNGHLPTPNGVHYGERLRVRFAPPPGETRMEVEIREMPPQKAACMSHHGHYYMIGETCGKIGGWVKETGAPVCGPFICMYYDDPKVTPPDELRSEAGVIVPADFATDDPRVRVLDIPGGTYAVTTHVGPYDGISAAWDEFAGKWFPSSGHPWREGPCVELYVADCVDVGMENARTELCLPITRSEG